MSTKLIVGITVVVAAAGAFFAGWNMKPAADDPAAGTEENAADMTDEPGLGTDAMLLANARGELEAERDAHDKTRKDLIELRERTEELEAKIAAGAADATSAGTPEKIEPGTTWYTPNEHADALKGIDWNSTGQAIVKLNPLLVKLAESIAAGKEFTELGELSKWNTPLALNAVQAARKGVPGTGPNGAFSHPSLLVNMVHAALVQGGKPLDEGQEKNLRAIADRFLASDSERMSRYDENTFGIQRLVDEAALKTSLYGDIDAMLSEEQREILHPAAVRGRCGIDLFSPGIVFYTLYRPTRYDTPQALASTLTANVMAHFKLPEDLRSAVSELASDYAASFPSGYLDEDPDPLVRSQLINPGMIGQLFVRVDRARIAAERQMAFYKALFDRLPADLAEERTKVRSEVGFVLPVRWTE